MHLHNYTTPRQKIQRICVNIIVPCPDMGVTSIDEEADYDLFTEVRYLRALCLKRDISHIDILLKKGDVELFLISDDETDNISQALKITKNLDDAFESCRHKARKNNIRIFPFSTKDYDSCILESAPRPHLSGQPVKLRRINEIRQFVWKTVPEMGLYDAVQNGDSGAP